MPERRLDVGPLRKLVSAMLAFLAWLDGGAASADEDGQAREARLWLRELSSSRPPSEATQVYDSLGHLIQTTDAPAPAAYSLSLGGAGELLVATQTDLFVFTLDARGGLHFVARRQQAPGASEGDRPS